MSPEAVLPSTSQVQKLLSEFAKSTDDALLSARKLQSLLTNNARVQNREGISLLEVKNSQLLTYMSDMVHLMQLITSGKSIQNTAAIDRLVEIRTVLERIRPMEQKMKVQIDKLLQMAASHGPSSSSAQQGLNSAHAPRPGDLDFGDDDSSDSDDGEEGAADIQKKPKKYVAPKLIAMHYDEDDREKEQRLLDRAKRRAFNSSLVQDLRKQFTDAPEEIRETPMNHRQRAEVEDKKRYEEDMMVRLQVTKKQRQEQKQQKSANVMDSLLEFGDYSAFDRRDKDPTGTTKSRDKRGSKFGGRGGKTVKRGSSGGRRGGKRRK